MTTKQCVEQCSKHKPQAMPPSNAFGICTDVTDGTNEELLTLGASTYELQRAQGGTPKRARSDGDSPTGRLRHA